jgi:hypothetical protein
VLRVGAGERDEALDRAGVHLHVGVEEEDELAGRVLGGAVDPKREAEVLGGGEQADARELRAHELDRPVARGVVEDDDLHVRALGRLVDGAQARGRLVAAPIGDEQDRDVGRQTEASTAPGSDAAASSFAA